ncbi:MAG: hypothetical protein JWN27_3438 [Candidatus Eremiobacteraeota bacterium]|nr:hypothetical protein [Candidatus Eremiobacteraeota bacterium]
MTLLSAGVSAGFSLEGLLGSGNSDSFARYAASRSIALLLAVLIAIGARSSQAIALLGIVMTIVQGLDGVIGMLAHDPAKTYGPFAFAVLNVLAVGWLLRGQERRATDVLR